MSPTAGGRDPKRRGKPRIVAIVQARTGSTRLPGKVLEELCGTPVLAHVLNRVAAARGLDEVVVATTDLDRDDRVVEIATRQDVPCFRGSEDDVLSRYHGAAHAFEGRSNRSRDSGLSTLRSAPALENDRAMVRDRGAGRTDRLPLQRSSSEPIRPVWTRKS